MFEVAFAHLSHQIGIRRDVAHGKVGMTRLYARRIAMVKEIAFRHQ